MKIEYGELRKDRFGLGWARNVTVNGVEYAVSVKPGKRVRLAYSKKFGYHWYATVYRIRDGIVASLPCDKRAGAKALVEEALYREFCRLAFGPSYERVEDLLYDRAYRSRGYDSPERKALEVLREARYPLTNVQNGVG